MIKAILARHTHEEAQTLSALHLYDPDGLVFTCMALELPDRDNQRNISRIPSGKYKCIKRNSQKYNDHYHVTDVEGRSFILIHHGNFNHQTRGCILVGRDFYDLNHDGNLDVTSSRYTMKQLLDFGGDGFDLNVVDL